MDSIAKIDYQVLAKKFTWSKMYELYKKIYLYSLKKLRRPSRTKMVKGLIIIKAEEDDPDLKSKLKLKANLVVRAN